VEAVNSHGHSLEPRFDVVPVVVVEMTAQIVSIEGSQIPAAIDEKLCLIDVVFLGELMQECCRGVSPAAAEHIYFEQELRFRVDGSVEPFRFSVYLDLFLIDRDLRRGDRRRVALFIGRRYLNRPF
jgi:hypothetical protein